jgi:hypothetical protein
LIKNFNIWNNFREDVIVYDSYYNNIKNKNKLASSVFLASAVACSHFRRSSCKEPKSARRTPAIRSVIGNYNQAKTIPQFPQKPKIILRLKRLSSHIQQPTRNPKIALTIEPDFTPQQPAIAEVGSMQCLSRHATFAYQMRRCVSPFLAYVWAQSSAKFIITLPFLRPPSRYAVGTRAFSCKKNPGMCQRHHHLNDLIWRAPSIGQACLHSRNRRA